ncbi:C45 family autoproteolytic acyltransferase/hydrolase [Bacteroides xylanisolvens]|jgi:tetratricopeptide (TPR) repeat protein|uniref:C45 family peptidase n=1 Tax=Bacteroides xylanisolvens TaxID=371601 RepID=A0AAW4SP27_9BACE|nr:C45 family peptidase [Bacteroides xylanisolvens]MCA4467284.1 C45 family peptidase [Bacteroides xylanisolvens]MCA4471810.1 C45 family peptidase [Bacteroides xylanisolvens]MCA4480855.1 C45 family peptidase [Bacteroides xylanisolvens]MCA4490099.1 C45 family peptidase [Bacteroides xylanisolvens]MCA4494380.1 C45 family peptidase [Bacteroides xylanisolvens]
MHKTIKKIFKYTSCVLLSLLVILIAGVCYLYFSADMLTPKHEPGIIMTKVSHADTTIMVPAEVLYNDTLDLRYYDGNFLRHSESGLWELFVKGDAFQRGEAIGKLSSDLLHYQEKVFVDQIREIVPSDSYLKFLRFFIVLFNRHLGENVLEEYRNEIYGISLSCTHEYDFIGTPYERQLNYHSAHDLGHAMQDYMLVGCSSFATWGTQSADSSLLIGRNFDFYVGDAFAENKQVAFYTPDQGYKFASVGWPGMIGVLSGMNETGLTVTINAAKSAVPTGSATPISILTREILQYASTIDEAFAIAKKRKTFVSESILIGSAKDGKAAIIEKSPEKTVLFKGKESDRLISTNHYQSEEFSKDERNMENIRTSDSPYRFARLEELINENMPIDASKAASILRNHKGLQDADLGLANEMAINQFIAHHSVIFQPEKRLMWVSTSPWQCGKYVAYDLNKIFNDTINLQHEIYSSNLTIPADEFTETPEFQHLLTYKKLTPLLLKKIRKKEKIEEHVLKTYEASNPSLYYVYEVMGDYYEAMQQPQQAIAYWQKALKKPIPKLQEKERIQQKIQKQSKDGKES